MAVPVVLILGSVGFLAGILKVIREALSIHKNEQEIVRAEERANTRRAAI
jgi:hypothetical protein